MTRDERIDGLKILAAALPQQSEKMRCLLEVLQLRGEQLAEEVKPAPITERFHVAR